MIKIILFSNHLTTETLEKVEELDYRVTQKKNFTTYIAPSSQEANVLKTNMASASICRVESSSFRKTIFNNTVIHELFRLSTHFPVDVSEDVEKAER